VRAIPIAAPSPAALPIIRGEARYDARSVLPCRNAVRSRPSGVSSGLSGRSCDFPQVRPLRTQQRARFTALDDPALTQRLSTRGSTGDVATRRSNSQCSTHELDAGRADQMAHVDRLRQELLRKEVIQPHLPVRLPCYDFVPIADPTFDSSLHKGWATGFGCYRLS
jgi:hypothetical protein